MLRLYRLLRVAALLCAFCPLPLMAAEAPAPTLLSAERMRNDENSEITEASGKVELVQGKRVLRADRLSYNQRLDVATAEGHVSLTESDGQITYADRAEVTGNLKRGFVNQLRIMLSDNSRMAAQEAEKIGPEGRYQIMKQVTYSPCNLCVEDPSEPPLWQIKAAKVTKDDVEQQIIYRDAWLELAGVPIAYTPYLSHPDPKVKRRSGFLAPLAGSDSSIGEFIRVPYYFDIAPNSDATIMPTVSVQDGLQFMGQYRHRFEKGRLQFDGSVVQADRVNDQNIVQQDQVRGHLFASAEYDLTNVWRTGAEVAFTSDKSYLYRYKVPTRDVLRNHGYVQGFKGRDYASMDVYYFQDLRTGDRPTEPLAAPIAKASMLGEPGGTLGGRWSLDASMAMLARDQDIVPISRRGPDSRRFSAVGGWESTFANALGMVTTTNLSVRADTFWSDNFTNTDTGQTFNDEYTFRYLPRGTVTVRYPFGRQSGRWQQLLEPIASFTASPRLDEEHGIANEDSVDVEFDDTNLLSENRFPGIDRQEGGMRAVYGLRGGIYTDGGSRIDALFGQSYRFNRDTNFPTESGLREKRSDYVGRLLFRPLDWVYLNYGFRLDEEDFTPRRTEVDASVGPTIFRPSISYISVDRQDAGLNRETVSEMTLGFTSYFAQYWHLYGYHKRAIKPEAGPRNTRFGVAYSDECLNAELGVSRDHTTRPDIEPGTSVIFTLLFKNLGGIKGQSLNLGGQQAGAVQ